MIRIKIVGSNLMARIAEAERTGETGDKEVIEYFSRHQGSEFYLEDFPTLSHESICNAIKCGYDMRPIREKEKA